MPANPYPTDLPPEWAHAETVPEDPNFRWRTSDGRVLRLDEMTPTHLHNLCWFLWRKYNLKPISRFTAVAFTYTRVRREAARRRPVTLTGVPACPGCGALGHADWVFEAGWCAQCNVAPARQETLAQYRAGQVRHGHDAPLMTASGPALSQLASLLGMPRRVAEADDYLRRRLLAEVRQPPTAPPTPPAPLETFARLVVREGSVGAALRDAFVNSQTLHQPITSERLRRLTDELNRQGFDGEWEDSTSRAATPVGAAILYGSRTNLRLRLQKAGWGECLLVMRNGRFSPELVSTSAGRDVPRVGADHIDGAGDRLVAAPRAICSMAQCANLRTSRYYCAEHVERFQQQREQRARNVPRATPSNQLVQRAARPADPRGTDRAEAANAAADAIRDGALASQPAWVQRLAAEEQAKKASTLAPVDDERDATAVRAGLLEVD